MLARTVAAPSPGGGRPIEIERTRLVWDGDVVVHAIRTQHQEEGEPLVEERTYCFDDESFVPRAHADMVVDPRDGERARRWVFYVNDPIGTPEELVNARGELLGAFDRQAWGRTEAALGTATTRLSGSRADRGYGDRVVHKQFRYSARGRVHKPDPDRARGWASVLWVCACAEWMGRPLGAGLNYRLMNAGRSTMWAVHGMLIR
jgi:hypothetical protein